MQPNQTPNQPVRIVLNPEDTKPHICPCGCEVFGQGFILRKTSVFLGGNNELKLLQVIYCLKCFKLVPDFLPPSLRPVIDV